MSPQFQLSGVISLPSLLWPHSQPSWLKYCKNPKVAQPHSSVHLAGHRTVTRADHARQRQCRQPPVTLPPLHSAL